MVILARVVSLSPDLFKYYINIYILLQFGNNGDRKMLDKTRELIREIITNGQLNEDLMTLIYEDEYGMDKLTVEYRIEQGDKKDAEV